MEGSDRFTNAIASNGCRSVPWISMVVLATHTGVCTRLDEKSQRHSANCGGQECELVR